LSGRCARQHDDPEGDKHRILTGEHGDRPRNDDPGGDGGG